VFLKEHEHQIKGLQDAKSLIKTRVTDAKSILLKGGNPPEIGLQPTLASKGFISYQTAQKYQTAIRKAPTAATITNQNVLRYTPCTRAWPNCYE
jgi:hypothetical protein